VPGEQYGGQLILGVTDGGEIIGVPDVDALLLRVDDVAFNCAHRRSPWSQKR
jgi:hypothetical protein